MTEMSDATPATSFARPCVVSKASSVGAQAGMSNSMHNFSTSKSPVTEAAKWPKEGPSMSRRKSESATRCGELDTEATEAERADMVAEMRDADGRFDAGGPQTAKQARLVEEGSKRKARAN